MLVQRLFDVQFIRMSFAELLGFQFCDFDAGFELAMVLSFEAGPRSSTRFLTGLTTRICPRQERLDEIHN